MRDLYYEITDDGYHIYDKNEPMFHIHQYEPFIPDPSKSYEENAKAQIEQINNSTTTEDDEDVTTQELLDIILGVDEDE